MSASRDELVMMFKEADRRGDRSTAEAVMIKLEQMQQTQQAPTTQAQPQQPVEQAQIQPTDQQPPAVSPEQTGSGLGMAFSGVKREAPFDVRVGLDLAERKEEVTETFKELAGGKITPPEAFGQAVGKGVAGSLFDIMGEGVTEGIKAAEYVAPETTESIKEGWEYLTNTDTGQQVSKILEGGMKEYSKFKEANPRAAKNIESVVNIGMLVAPVKVKKNAGPSMPGKAATKLEKSAETSRRKNKQNFVDDLISPTKTKKVKEAETARTKEKGIGPFKKSVIELSKTEKAIAKEVNRILDVSKKKTIQGNLNVIEKTNETMAINLAKKLKDVKKPVPRKHVLSNINKALIEVLKKPSLVGSEKVAERYAAEAKKIIDNYPGTPKGLLDARKEFDQIVKKEKGDILGDVGKENAHTVSARAIRNSLNDMIAKQAPSVSVKKDLRRQSLLYDAIENLRPKAAKEPNTAILRAWENAAKATQLKGRANQELALMLGMGTLGAMAAFAPYITAGFAAILGTRSIKNLVMAPDSRKGVAKLIKMTDRAILSSKNPSMIKQLRADRMILVDFLKSEDETQ